MSKKIITFLLEFLPDFMSVYPMSVGAAACAAAALKIHVTIDLCVKNVTSVKTAWKNKPFYTGERH